MKQLYPLGSIVRLKAGMKRIMICGRLQVRDHDQKLFDYCACLYPEGILNPKEMFLFQHEDIDELVFQGFEDEDEIKMKQYIEKRKNEWLSKHKKQS